MRLRECLLIKKKDIYCLIFFKLQLYENEISNNGDDFIGMDFNNTNRF